MGIVYVCVCVCMRVRACVEWAGVEVGVGVGVGVGVAARHLARAGARQGLRGRHRKEREALTGERVWRWARTRKRRRHAPRPERDRRVIGGQRLRRAHADARAATRRLRAVRPSAAKSVRRPPCAVRARRRAASRAEALAAPSRRGRRGPPGRRGGRPGGLDLEVELRRDPARCSPEQAAQEAPVTAAAAVTSPDADSLR